MGRDRLSEAFEMVASAADIDGETATRPERVFELVECVRERRTPLSDGASGLAVVRVLAAAQTSLERGGAPVALSRQAEPVS